MDEVFQLLDYLGIQSQSTIQTYARLAHRRHLKRVSICTTEERIQPTCIFLFPGFCGALRSAQAETNIPSVFCTNTAMRTSA